MQKAKQYDWKDSNLALFGSDLDRQVKKESAEKEPAWTPVLENRRPHLYVWRIENFKVVEWPKELYGKFYSGDSYIILNAYLEQDKLCYDVHFWIGKESTADEYGTAAYKTVELDTLLDDLPVQHREVQGHESRLMRSYFPEITYLAGGCPSGFRNVRTREYKPRLLHFKGERQNIVVWEVSKSRGSLDNTDVYILDLGDRAIQWNSSGANKNERFKAAQYLQGLKSERNGRLSCEIIEEETADPAAEPDRSSRNSRLRTFYQQQQGESDAVSVGLNVDPCDIDGAGFDPEVYLSKLLQEQPLTSLMDKEQQMVDQIRQLDSDMQTLVYDNYSKFISATDTIRKMKSDFHRMEQEMNNLAESVSAMSQQAADIRQHVGGKRADLKRLAGVSALLRKLQYLLDLPARLTELRREGAYQQAIRAWQQADRVLSRYADLPSFRPIRADCLEIIAGLRAQLWQRFNEGGEGGEGGGSPDARQLAELVDLLGQLGESEADLSAAFLRQADPRMQRLLGDLEAQAGSLQDDVLQFVDQGCNHLVSELCILIAVFGDIFPSPESREKLEAYHESVMRSYLAIVSKRFCLEARESGGSGDSLLVRACDRFHRKLQAMHRLVTEGELSVRALAVVCDAAAERAAAVRAQLDLRLAAALSGLRSQLATAGGSGARGLSLPQLMAGLLRELVDAVKAALAGLQAFLATDVSFSLKPTFRERFCVRAVRQDLLAGFLSHQAAQCAGLAQLSPSPPSLLLLLLSRFCLDYRNSSLHYLCTLADEQFLVPESPQAEALVTPVSELSAVYSDSAAELLQAYVCVSGGTLAGMLRKSVDARDWLQGIEPRSVRAVVKRVVEDLAGIDASVSSLYDEAPSGGGGGRGGGDRSSDSSAGRLVRRPLTAASRSQWSATPSTLGNSLLHRLFSDKVDLLGPAEFGRASVVSGVVRLALKTLLECVRLKTFGRYGLQQVQVDCHYLHAFLWRYVSDDSVVHFLLEEILASAAHRCIDPVFMEQSVVELIVERD